MMITIQYLEASPELRELDPADVVAQLHTACTLLPIDALLIGWDVPPLLLRACADEARRHQIPLYRWHPLLTSDGVLELRAEWMTIGAHGASVPGFLGMPEFTFVCPNNPDARAAVLARLQDALQGGLYQGIFLDRMRWPSPAADPIGALACFCAHCRAQAAEQGIDLEAQRHQVLALDGDPALVRELFRRGAGLLAPLQRFRHQSITSLVSEAATAARALGYAVGLDGFSPALTPLVGQELGVLSSRADWTKIMSYGHTLGPAGLPFELLGLADWLVARCGLEEQAALQTLAVTCELPLPGTRALLRNRGLSAPALATEVHRAAGLGIKPVLFGIELVELPGVAELQDVQIRADLAAIYAAKPDGLAISWDLRFIPAERLALVRDTVKASL